MTAGKAVDIDLHVKHIARDVCPYVLELGIVAYATRATDEDLALILRVKVDEDIALKKLWRESLGTGKTGLLVNGEEAVYRTVLELLVGKHRHSRGYTDTVVGTQCRTLGLEPLAIDIRLDGILLEIMVKIGALVTYHIHMALQDNGLAVLITRISRFLDEHVTHTVGNCLITQLLTEILEECRDLGLVL